MQSSSGQTESNQSSDLWSPNSHEQKMSLTSARNNDAGVQKNEIVIEKAPSSGWRAGIEVELKHLNGRTLMGRTRHYGPLRIQRPFWPEGNDLTHLYILHPPGGLVAGDELIQQFSIRQGAAGLVTTPAAGKVYFNGNGQLQKQITSITVSDMGSMEWLPQETILFNGAIAELNTSIDLSGSGQYAGWDIICLGRTASGEQFTQGKLTQNFSLTRDDKPLFRERLQFDAQSGVTRSLLGLNGCTIFGTFLMTLDKAPDTTELQQYLEEQNWHRETAITYKAGVFIARYLGNSSEQARTVFTHLWQKTRPFFNGRKACQPRIWNT